MPGFIFRPLRHSLTTLSSVAYDLARLLVLDMRSRRDLAAENLYLQKQLALFQERKVKPRRAHDSTRLVMVILGRMFSWRDALVNVKPDTVVDAPIADTRLRFLESMHVSVVLAANASLEGLGSAGISLLEVKQQSEGST